MTNCVDVSPSLAASREPLAHRQNVASLRLLKGLLSIGITSFL